MPIRSVKIVVSNLLLPTDDFALEYLLTAAEALYKAREQGRNGVVCTE
ncbi:MAG: hypothetical protein HY306_00555 [Nitrosomonadales bacterium]|nr:hypothetical protein [Nitrosomonadales bacterium]